MGGEQLRAGYSSAQMTNLSPAYGTFNFDEVEPIRTPLKPCPAGNIEPFESSRHPQLKTAFYRDSKFVSNASFRIWLQENEDGSCHVVAC